jgi:hypothetical protein
VTAILILAGAVVAVLAIVAVVGSIARTPPLPPALLPVLAAPPWEKLDSDTWTRDRKPRPTIFFTPSGNGQHRLWLHYYDDGLGNVPGLSVDAFVAPASPTYQTELPGLPDGVSGSVSFEVREGSRWVQGEVREEHIARAREWLADAGALTALPGSKVSIDPSPSGGFRVHVYWTGGPDELAVAMRVAESVEARMVPNYG